MKALIVVDYENEWIDKNSEYYVGDLSERISKLNKLIAYCRENNIPIIFTQHIEPESEGEFKEGTTNIEIISGIDYQPEKDILITKNKISPFYKTDLEQKLKEKDVDELVITGILTNLCVRSIVEGAYDRDFDITVITDTSASFTNETQEFTIKDLKETREEVEFKTVDEFMGA